MKCNLHTYHLLLLFYDKPLEQRLKAESSVQFREYLSSEYFYFNLPTELIAMLFIF